MTIIPGSIIELGIFTKKIMSNFDIKEELKKLPNKPGVYIMRDVNDTIMYVGKAINLHNRVRSYFRTNPNVVLQELDKKAKTLQQIDQSILEHNTQYSYIIDNNLDDYTKFVMYVNQNEGDDFITVEELIKLLEDKIV